MKGVTNHIYYTGGSKTVCVSHCLAALGIHPSSYNYTSSKNDRLAYKNVLRRFGYSVASRASELKVKKYGRTSYSALRGTLRKSSYGANDRFLVVVFQRHRSHLILLNGNGEVIMDTAPKMRWNVERVDIVKR